MIIPAEIVDIVVDVVNVPPINGRVDANLILAIITAESDGRVHVVSNKGAIGLMQITEVALKDVNEKYGFKITMEDLKKPEINIFVGAIYFKDLLMYWRKKEHNKELALNWAIMSYNWGLGNVRKWLYGKGDNSTIDENIPSETKNNLFNVLYWYSYYIRKRK